jgi:hypothetical protein
MAGKTQVRAVMVIFVVAGIIILLPYPLSFFLDGLSRDGKRRIVRVG